MRGSAWFTILDLTKGYHQMILDTGSREFTAFTTPMGLYQWKVFPMGMKTSGHLLTIDGFGSGGSSAENCCSVC